MQIITTIFLVYSYAMQSFIVIADFNVSTMSYLTCAVVHGTSLPPPQVTKRHVEFMREEEHRRNEGRACLYDPDIHFPILVVLKHKSDSRVVRDIDINKDIEVIVLQRDGGGEVQRG